MIFIDTGAFLARYLERDQYHIVATEHWRILRNDRRRCLTSNFVLDETITLLARRSTYQFAAHRARNLYQSASLSVLRPDEADELAAVKLFQKYSDQSISFTDCVSFTLLNKRNIKSAFSFDRHFGLAGFDVEPVRIRPLARFTRLSTCDRTSGEERSKVWRLRLHCWRDDRAINTRRGERVVTRGLAS